MDHQWTLRPPSANPVAHALHPPGRIWEGDGCAALLAERLQSYRSTRPAIVIDPTVADTAFGAAAVAAAGPVVVRWDHVSPNAPRQDAEQLARELATRQADSVIAVGGGSTLDTAKAAVILHATGRTLDDLWASPPLPTPPERLPLLAVPTTCGTGAETSPFAVLLDTPSGRKRALTGPGVVPTEAFLDPAALATLPPRLVAATGIDAFAHALEAYVSAEATPMTRAATLGTVTGIARTLQAAVDGDPTARAGLLGYSSAARLLFPHVGLTVAHAISHPLGIRLDLHHGEAVAACLPASIRYNAATHPAGYAHAARTIGITTPHSDDHEAAGCLAGWITGRLRGWDLDRPPASGLDVAAVAADAMRSRNIPSNPRPITTPEALHEVIHLAIGAPDAASAARPRRASMA